MSNVSLKKRTSIPAKFGLRIESYTKFKDIIETFPRNLPKDPDSYTGSTIILVEFRQKFANFFKKFSGKSAQPPPTIEEIEEQFVKFIGEIQKERRVDRDVAYKAVVSRYKKNAGYPLKPPRIGPNSLIKTKELDDLVFALVTYTIDFFRSVWFWCQARHLAEVIIALGIVPNISHKIINASAFVNRYLKKHGLVRDPKRPINENVHRTVERNRHRRAFIDFMTPIVTGQKAHKLIYLDESFYHTLDSNVKLTPSLPQDCVTYQHDIEPHRYKGERHIMLCAMITHNSCDVENTTEIIMESWVCFNPRAEEQKTLTGEFFEKWFIKNIMPLVDDETIIIMDSAGYHTRIDPKWANLAAMKKEELRALIEEEGGNGQGTKKNILDNNAEIIEMNKIPLLEKLVGEKGGEILYTPPNVHEYQPVEYIWADIKKKTRATYKRGRKTTEIPAKLKGYLEKLQAKKTETLAGMVKNCFQLINDDRSKRLEERDPEVIVEEYLQNIRNEGKEIPLLSMIPIENGKKLYHWDMSNPLIKKLDKILHEKLVEYCGESAAEPVRKRKMRDLTATRKKHKRN